MNFIIKLNLFIHRKAKDRWLYLIGLMVCMSILMLCIFPLFLKLISISIGDSNELQSTLTNYQESFVLLPTFFISIYFVFIWLKEGIGKTKNKNDLLLGSIICTSLIIITLNIFFISI